MPGIDKRAQPHRCQAASRYSCPAEAGPGALTAVMLVPAMALESVPMVVMVMVMVLMLVLEEEGVC